VVEVPLFAPDERGRYWPRNVPKGKAQGYEVKERLEEVDCKEGDGDKCE
jgi:hypothetical protein